MNLETSWYLKHEAQANPTASECPSTAATQSERLGLTPTEEPVDEPRLLPVTLDELIQRAWMYGGISLQSNFARENAALIGEAASAGYISTEFAPYEYGTKWLVTKDGLDFYWSAF